MELKDYLKNEILLYDFFGNSGHTAGWVDGYKCILKKIEKGEFAATNVTDFYIREHQSDLNKIANLQEEIRSKNISIASLTANSSVERTMMTNLIQVQDIQINKLLNELNEAKKNNWPKLTHKAETRGKALDKIQNILNTIELD